MVWCAFVRAALLVLLLFLTVPEDEAWALKTAYGPLLAGQWNQLVSKARAVEQANPPASNQQKQGVLDGQIFVTCKAPPGQCPSFAKVRPGLAVVVTNQAGKTFKSQPATDGHYEMKLPVGFYRIKLQKPFGRDNLPRHSSVMIRENKVQHLDITVDSTP